jgi:hypothetical protein
MMAPTPVYVKEFGSNDQPKFLGWRDSPPAPLCGYGGAPFV